MNVIGAFDGTEYRFLSNFYRAGIIIDGKYYPTSEHFYQSMKSTDVKVQESLEN